MPQEGQSTAVSINHYENFPVASWLCPPAIRPAITAIYHFARTADDIADEGSAPDAQRLALLAELGTELQRAVESGQTDGKWQHILRPLAQAIEQHQLPPHLLFDLLSAFTQDVGNPVYADRTGLLDYCSRSANPVGRLLLHLAGVTSRDALIESDAVCTALQLINFWQDLSVDLPRGRVYVTASDARNFGLDAAHLQPRADSDATRALIRALVDWSRATMLAGAPLVHRLPGRMGWELRLVVQGGLRVLEKIEGLNFNAMTQRPKLGKRDAPTLAWRALRMRRGSSVAAQPARTQDKRIS